MQSQNRSTTIERVSIVDDDERARESYGYALEELGLSPVKEKGPLRDMQEVLERLQTRVDAVICDYHLGKIGNYASFDGDEIVVKCYMNSFPALLCTTYTDLDTYLMRSRKRFIPAILKPDQLDPDNIARGFERCVQEFNGHFQPSRRPWRTLVRVEEVEAEWEYFYVVISGWSSREKIRISFDDLPCNFRSLVKAEKRFHAQVNVGAENHEDLYFDSWEAD